MKIDSLSLSLEEEEEEEGLNRGRELKQFGLLRTNTLSISFGMHGYYQGLYLCVLLCSLLTFEHTRPTANQTKPSSKKKVNSTPVDVCVFISFSLRFVFVFFCIFQTSQTDDLFQR